MRIKQIHNKDVMSKAIREGITQIASIVKRTLGPGGLPILIEREGHAPTGEPLSPIITKDGVTVANECQHEDPTVDLVIQAVKAICSRTNRVAGDGTTTAIVLGEALLTYAFELLEADPQKNPQIVRESIEAAVKKVIEELKTIAMPVSDPDKIEAVATISANGDEEIGKIIRQAFEAVGSEGVITVDEGHSPQTTIQIVEGFQMRRGAEATDRFFNNNERTKFEAQDVNVIIYDGKLDNFTQLLPALQCIAEKFNHKSLPPILIMANEFSNEVLTFLLIQRAERGLSFCAVKSPHTTTVRTGMLDDIAIMLGGNRLGNGERNLESTTYDNIGIARRVVVDKYTTTFYDGQGAEEDVLNRVKQLKALRDEAESPYDASIISDRIAALSNGIAKIGVGGSTDLEIKERYHRIEDALNAARAAVEQGIVPGGGTALLRIANKLLDSDENKLTDGEFIVASALRAPFVQIIENIGDNPTLIETQIRDALMSGEPIVYDARRKIVTNALEAGIVDPVKVTRTALENATSIAALLSTCGGGIAFTRDK